MKKLRQFLLISVLAIGSAVAQNQYPVNWVNYDLINPGNDVSRGLTYNPHTDHVLVASRMFGADVMILDAATGDSLGKLDNSLFSGGTLPVNQVGVAADGTIYVCNLMARQFTPTATFKVYRFANESAPAELVYDGILDEARYGDSFAVSGSGSEIYIYSSGLDNPSVAVLKDTGGSALAVDTYIFLPLAGNARHGIFPMEPGGRIWVNGAQSGFPPVRLLSNTGTIIATVPDTLASPGGTSTVVKTTLGNYDLITVANSNTGTATIRSIRYFEDLIGTITFDYFGEDSDSSALFYNGGASIIPNINATASLAYDSKRHAMITLMGVNSIASLSMDSLLQASTPRQDILEISVDGSNDFFPTDHVGRSNGRDMYLTWSEGKVFAGITGDDMIDATFTNFWYVAFDLDPDGSNGSNTIALETDAVTQLPFNADVVFEIESYDQADFLLGNIHKWNGSSWDVTLFDGNLASQGALAFADAGNRKLAEFAAILNDAGIGNDFTNIGIAAFVAEKSPGGSVLAAFPDVNPLGAGVALTHYFYADSLGSGMFPTDTTYVQIRSGLVGIGDGEALPIEQFRLLHNYPNPFNPSTTIEYFVPKRAEITVEIYNVTGQKVQTLSSGVQNAGNYSLTFDGKNVASGVYFYRLSANGLTVQTRKMLLVK